MRGTMSSTSSDERSVEGFCRRWSISRATFYNLKRRGLAPAIMKLGTRTIVSPEAEEAWRLRMEAETAAQEQRLAAPSERAAEHA